MVSKSSVGRFSNGDAHLTGVLPAFSFDALVAWRGLLGGIGEADVEDEGRLPLGDGFDRESHVCFELVCLLPRTLTAVRDDISAEHESRAPFERQDSR